MLNSINQCELRGTTQAYTTDLCQGIESTLGTGTQLKVDADFSIKPLCCLNKMSTDNNGLPMAKSGIVRLQLSLARNADAIFGQAQDAYSSWS